MSLTLSRSHVLSTARPRCLRVRPASARAARLNATASPLSISQLPPSPLSPWGQSDPPVVTQGTLSPSHTGRSVVAMAVRHAVAKGEHPALPDESATQRRKPWPCQLQTGTASPRTLAPAAPVPRAHDGVGVVVGVGGGAWWGVDWGYLLTYGFGRLSPAQGRRPVFQFGHRIQQLASLSRTRSSVAAAVFVEK